MALQATFVADFSKWDAELKKAQAGLKTFEVSGKGVAKQLEQMSKSFSGVNIKKEADLAVASVKAIGGASKLTEQEQRKLNATVTEAIAKYRALGQQAPAELRKLAAETAQVEKSTGRMSSSLVKMGGLLAGAFSVGAIVNLSRKVLQLGSDLADMSAKTGIGVEALQEFKFAGGLVGVSLEQITGAVNQMQNRISEGDKSAVGALKRLNISFDDFKKLKPEDQFQAVADAVGGIKDPAERVRTAMDLMGKTGAQVLPALTAGFADARAEALKLGVVLDEKTVQALDRMGERVEAIQGVYLAGFARLLVELEPLLIALAKGLASSATWLGKMQDEFEFMLVGIGKTTEDLANLEVGFYKLAESINPAAKMMGTFTASIADAESRAEDARQWVKAMSDGIVRDTTKALIALAKLGEVRSAPIKLGGGGGTAPSDEEIKRFEKWRDEVTGAATEKALQQLTKDWAALSLAERQSVAARQAVTKQYEALRVLLPSVGGALEEVRNSTIRALVPFQGLQAQIQGLATNAMPDAVRMFRNGQSAVDNLNRSGTLLSRTVVSLADGMTAMPGILKSTAVAANDLELQQKEAAESAELWRQNLEDLAGAFALLSQIAPGALGKVASLLGKVTGSINLAVKGWDSFMGGIKAFKSGDLLAGLSGMASGVLGIASAVLSLGKAIADLFKSRADKTMERVAYEFGVSISKELAQGIEDEAERLFGGNRQASKIFHLDEILSEAGGLSAENIRPMFARLRDLFVMLETGAFNSAQAVEVLDENFRTFADFVTEGGSLASKELLEIIKLADEAGLKSAEIAAFTSAEANKALAGLGKFVTSRGEIFDKLGEAQKKLDELRKKAGDDSADIDPKDIEKAANEVERLKQQLEAIPLTAAGAGAVGASLFAIFEELVEGGQPAIEVLKQIDPLIESLDEQLKAAGVSGGAAFEALKGMSELATGEFAASFEAISGLGSALSGLHNAGLLNQETFGGLAEQITATFEGLKAQGVDGAAAMQLIQPTLQDLWELQKDFGYEVDDATGKLLEEAEAAGLVGDEHRTATEQMLLLTQRMVTAIEGLATLFGVDLVGEVGAFTEAINDIPDPVIEPEINWPEIELPDFGGGDYDRYPPKVFGHDVQYARGGLVPKYLAGGGPIGSDTVPAWLTPGEFVMRREAVNRIGAGALSQMNSGSGGDSSVAIIVLQPGATVDDVIAAFPASMRRNEKQVGAKVARELQKYGVR